MANATHVRDVVTNIVGVSAGTGAVGRWAEGP